MPKKRKLHDFLLDNTEYMKDYAKKIRRKEPTTKEMWQSYIKKEAQKRKLEYASESEVEDDTYMENAPKRFKPEYQVMPQYESDFFSELGVSQTSSSNSDSSSDSWPSMKEMFWSSGGDGADTKENENNMEVGALPGGGGGGASGSGPGKPATTEVNAFDTPKNLHCQKCFNIKTTASDITRGGTLAAIYWQSPSFKDIDTSAQHKADKHGYIPRTARDQYLLRHTRGFARVRLVGIKIKIEIASPTFAAEKVETLIDDGTFFTWVPPKEHAALNFNQDGTKSMCELFNKHVQNRTWINPQVAKTHNYFSSAPTMQFKVNPRVNTYSSLFNEWTSDDTVTNCETHTTVKSCNTVQYLNKSIVGKWHNIQDFFGFYENTFSYNANAQRRFVFDTVKNSDSGVEGDPMEGRPWGDPMRRITCDFRAGKHRTVPEMIFCGYFGTFLPANMPKWIVKQTLKITQYEEYEMAGYDPINNDMIPWTSLSYGSEVNIPHLGAVNTDGTDWADVPDWDPEPITWTDYYFADRG